MADLTRTTLRAGITSASTVMPLVTNLNRSNTNKWRAARGKVQAGVSNARIVCSGNSITAGAGATGGSGTLAALMGSNAASKSYPTQLAQCLTGRGLTASWQSFMGGQTNITDWGTHDSRIVQGASASNLLSNTIGATTLRTNNATTPIQFTPSSNVDTVVVAQLRSSGTLTVSNDASAVLASLTAPVITNNAILLQSPITLDGAAGTKVIKFSSSSGSPVVVGAIAYNSAVKEVQVIRAGIYGAVVSSQALNPYPANSAIQTLAPDLTLMAWTRNEYGTLLDIPTYKSTYQDAITAAKVSGDVMLVIEPMGSVGDNPATAPYYQAVYDLAQTNNLPVIDFTRLWDGYISSWYVDGIHPTGFGYAEMARQIAEILLIV